MKFYDREDAGRRLADRLHDRAGRDGVVLGIARSGVPVAAVVARALGAPLDVVVTRRLGVPFQPGTGLGAVGEDGTLVVDDGVVRAVGAGEAELAEVERRERETVTRLVARYRSVRPPEPIEGRTAVVVDEGAVTGSSARAACRSVRARGASRIVLAVPFCPVGVMAGLREVADEVVVLEVARELRALGEDYAVHPPVDDDEVLAVLGRRGPVRSTRPIDGEPVAHVDIRVDRVAVSGHLVVPVEATGLVVFAHASGSSRFDPRHRETARSLRAAGMATFVVDLLAPREELVRERVFRTGMLATRLGAALTDVRRRPTCRGLPVGLLAESTAGAAALATAARRDDVDAVVCGNGRPDLVAPELPRIVAPVLLIVGDRDPVLVDLNRRARQALPPNSRLRVVAGTGRADGEHVPHGAPTRAAELACDWFARHLPAVPTGADGGPVGAGTFDPADVVRAGSP
ncbi:phosphoribosyltransferase family protein [Actinomycetospora cinnamomea]|uniref:Putative phosphoribosyl transferase n=1 Tax=Actinomycetospora cinnamomea TaxID=663609 RepID=A0A2U1F3T7_9PSEU|nr:phosphoribosyltransferase family protein [Actinomycetospora cinnamomea]PVZ06837.1 putative phosphoribosyl transferase [Actinomycetospora cinnamomea]